MLGAFLGGAGTVFFTAVGSSSARVSENSASILGQKKRCEKCKRGADGKMVCEEVPCPK
jgi:hypothetical protein